MACFISFPILGMIFGAPSVFIAAIALSFYRTINRCIYGDLTIDRSYYMRAIIEEAMIIGGIIILVIFVGIMSNIFR